MLFFVVKQKTAYEMRISDWSSDVCASDLSMAMDAYSSLREGGVLIEGLTMKEEGSTARSPAYSDRLNGRSDYVEGYTLAAPAWQKVYPAYIGSDQIGRAPCRERVCQSV